MPQPLWYCYSATHTNHLIQSRRIDAAQVISYYVCLHRKKDGEAWRVVEAFSVGPAWEVGTKVKYRDSSIRDFDAKVISKAEYETFKFFEKEGQ